MTERLCSFLGAAQIDISSLELLKTGASGANVLKCMRGGARCVAKYVEKAAVSGEIWRSSLREYDLLTAAARPDFMPEVLFARRDADALLIVEPEYRPIAAEEWTEELLQKAMELCAKLHASASAPFMAVSASESAQADEWRPADSLDLWLKLAEKFPDTVDSALLEDICVDFGAISARMAALELPEGPVHGDCHPENFLLDGDKMRLCDWQGANVGRGVGDISFFFSRGADMGVQMDENALINAYLAALGREGTILSREAFDKSCAESTLTVSFRFWAMFLQDAPEARVAEIYRPMAAAYRMLFE